MVEEIGDDELRLMAKLKDKVEYYCLNQSLVEVLGKVARSLLESETYKWINPTVQAFLKALD